MKVSRHNKKTANFPPTDDCIFFFPVVIKIYRHDKKNANFPPEPKTNTTAQPARQTTVSFFSGRNRQNRAPIRQTTVSFFSGRNVSFFPVVMKISRHNKKTANFVVQKYTHQLADHNKVTQ
jgi:hypothetical protein